MSASDSYALKGKKVWVAGHRGMVGSAIVRRLEREDCDVVIADRSRVDFRNQDAVSRWVSDVKPQAVFIAAARVGGILANDTRPYEFLYENLVIETNTIEAARAAGAEKLLFLGSSCIYPKFAPQPITEDALLTGALEPTNEWYAIAKIAGIKLCQAARKQHGSNFISAMPSNLYGPGDNFDLTSSHVMPALIRKAHAAKLAGEPELVVWGSGTPRREFLYVEDCADALVHLMKTYDGYDHVNVGSGADFSIGELATMVSQAVGFTGELVYDRTKPDGTPRKLMDITRLRSAGWQPATPLKDGLEKTYQWYLKNAA